MSEIASFLNDLDTEKLLSSMAKAVGLSVPQVRKVLRSAHRRYKVYKIPKKNGTGERIIEQPTPEVKALQRFLVENVLSKFPIHLAATAYRTGVGIEATANVHRKSKAILKLDFVDFFASLRQADLKYILEAEGVDFAKHQEWSGCLFREGGKPYRYVAIGAPSSPILSNLLMYPFDCLVAEYCVNRKCVYTRYADDITVSADDGMVLREVKGFVEDLTRRTVRPSLKINQDKTFLGSRGQRLTSLGLVITPEESISVGRSRKRYLRLQLFRYKNGYLAEKDLLYLRGLLAFVKAVEPSFYFRLQLSYGQQLFKKLFSES